MGGKDPPARHPVVVMSTPMRPPRAARTMGSSAEAGGYLGMQRRKRSDARAAKVQRTREGTRGVLMTNGIMPPIGVLDDPVVRAQLADFEEDEDADGY